MAEKYEQVLETLRRLDKEKLEEADAAFEEDSAWLKEAVTLLQHGLQKIKPAGQESNKENKAVQKPEPKLRGRGKRQALAVLDTVVEDEEEENAANDISNTGNTGQESEVQIPAQEVVIAVKTESNTAGQEDSTRKPEEDGTGTGKPPKAPRGRPRKKEATVASQATIATRTTRSRAAAAPAVLSDAFPSPPRTRRTRSKKVKAETPAVIKEEPDLESSEQPVAALAPQPEPQNLPAPNHVTELQPSLEPTTVVHDEDAASLGNGRELQGVFEAAPVAESDAPQSMQSRQSVSEISVEETKSNLRSIEGRQAVNDESELMPGRSQAEEVTRESNHQVHAPPAMTPVALLPAMPAANTRSRKKAATRSKLASSTKGSGICPPVLATPVSAISVVSRREHSIRSEVSAKPDPSASTGPHTSQRILPTPSGLPPPPLLPATNEQESRVPYEEGMEDTASLDGENGIPRDYLEEAVEDTALIVLPECANVGTNDEVKQAETVSNEQMDPASETVADVSQHLPQLPEGSMPDDAACQESDAAQMPEDSIPGTEDESGKASGPQTQGSMQAELLSDVQIEADQTPESLMNDIVLEHLPPQALAENSITLLTDGKAQGGNTGRHPESQSQDETPATLTGPNVEGDEGGSRKSAVDVQVPQQQTFENEGALTPITDASEEQLPQHSSQQAVPQDKAGKSASGERLGTRQSSEARMAAQKPAVSQQKSFITSGPNLVTSHRSLLPAKPQAGAPPAAGKRGNEVDALKVAEAARRREQAREAERQKQKEALLKQKADRAKHAQQVKANHEEAQKRVAEESRRREELARRKEEEAAARRRAREEAERKEKEEKQRKLEEAKAKRKQDEVRKEELVKKRVRELESRAAGKLASQEQNENKRPKVAEYFAKAAALMAPVKPAAPQPSQPLALDPMQRLPSQEVKINTSSAIFQERSQATAALPPVPEALESIEIAPYRSDEDEEEEEMDEKEIPIWAQAANLRREIIGQQRLDPDELFQQHEKTCPLDEVFSSMRKGQEEKRDLTRRTSTGNWLEDRVTWKEEMNYKKAMGYL